MSQVAVYIHIAAFLSMLCHLAASPTEHDCSDAYRNSGRDCELSGLCTLLVYRHGEHVVPQIIVMSACVAASRRGEQGPGLVLCRPGPFQLELQDGIRAYRATKPALVLVGTAAVERNAVIGDDEAARKADIPIVQLNPGGKPFLYQL